jgi:hypothetical protein
LGETNISIKTAQHEEVTDRLTDNLSNWPTDWLAGWMIA